MELGYRIVHKHTLKWLFAIAAVGAVAAFGGETPDAVVGRVVSNHPITINGRQIPAQAVVSWPVSVADEVATSTESAMIQFRDGSTLLLQGDSTARVEASKSGSPSGSLIVRVLKGVGQPSFAPGSTAQFFNASGKTISAVLPRSAVQPGSLTSGSSSTATRGLIPLPGRPVQVGTAPVSTTPVYTGLSGVLVQPLADSPNSGPTVILPNGTRLTLTVDPKTNSYTVTAITIPVDTPTGQVFLPVTNTTLLNTTVSVSTQGSTTNAGTNVSVSFTDTTTKKPVDVEAAQKSLQTAGEQAVQDAIKTGTVPANTPAPVLNTPVKVGTFSQAAP